MTETSIFPLVKRFGDVKASPKTVMLCEEMTIHQKCFRSGTILFITGWRELNGKAFLILNKGSWEGLVDFHEISNSIVTLK
jgi:hypothetical protein